MGIVHGYQKRRTDMRIVDALTVALFAASAFAKLPPPTDEAKLQAAESAAKSAWNDRVALYQLCVAMDRTADAYRKSIKAAGKDVPDPTATPPCTDPGSYVSPLTPATSKPLEAAGAHSPPGTAVSPPNTKATAAEISADSKR
jgi:hypothetical protein